MDNQQQLEILRNRFGPEIVEWKEQWGELTVVVKREAIVRICEFLRDEPGLEYNFLSSVTGVDLGVDANPRFEVVYHLYSIPQRHRIRLKVRVNEDQPVPTVTGVWKAADWYERETYDFFGVTFDGHPNLRRIMMPDEYEGHPLRKDFPLRGYRR
ncbi:MAG: NADH-quinone oxidoreductase subunit C [Acidobacteria bacterium]|nr:MAG: NADH-quinone oxidoreductase subunit C [Acidobacteriota bacterium]